MDIHPSRETSRVPQLRSLLLPKPVAVPAPGVSKKVIWCVSIALGLYSSFYLCSPRPSISLILDPIALPPSPTSPSPTQASSAAPHAPTWLTLSHYFFPDDALNPPCIIAFATGASTHSSPVSLSQPPAIISSLSKYRPLSTIICPRRTRGPNYSPSTSSTCTTPATRSATATPT